MANMTGDTEGKMAKKWSISHTPKHVAGTKKKTGAGCGWIKDMANSND